MNLLGRTPDDHEIVLEISKNSGKRRQCEAKLYSKYSYLIKEGVFKHRLNEDESSIAYSDSVLTLIENIEKGVFEERSSIKTYLHRIFSNKCVDQVRKNATNKESVNVGTSVENFLNYFQDDTKSIIESLMEQYNTDLLWKCLKELGEKCQQIIKAWSEDKQDKEIAIKLGYSSSDVVKTSRLRCLDKLRSVFTQRFEY